MRHILLLVLGMFLVIVPLFGDQVYTDNVVMVIDTSGSMEKKMTGTRIKRLDAAKRAIREVVKSIPPTTHVGLLVFTKKSDGWVYPLGPRDDKKLFGVIDSLKAKHDTPLGKFMKKGADRLLEARQMQFGYGSYRLLVVTDGQASDKDLVDKYAPDIISRGIVVDVIGVDMATDHTLATKVHSYRRANDPNALQQAIQEVFAEVGKGGDGQSDDDSFEELKSLPDGLAMAILTALSSSGNHGIGTKPAVTPSTTPAQSQPVAVKQSADSSQPPAPNAGDSKNTISGPVLALLSIVLFTGFFLWLIKVVGMGKKKI